MRGGRPISYIADIIIDDRFNDGGAYTPHFSRLFLIGDWAYVTFLDTSWLWRLGIG